MQARILLVEDDSRLRALLQATLRRENFSVTLASSAERANELLGARQFDLVVLEVLLPGLRRPGLKRLLTRAQKCSTPVIMLKTGRRAGGLLDSRHEDLKQLWAAYVDPVDLMARVKEQLRKLERFRIAELDAVSRQHHPLVFGKVTVDTNTRAVLRDGQETYLRPKEFNLLCFLLERPGVVCSRSEIMRHVWGPNHPSAPKAVDVTMRSLRQKVEDDPSKPRYLLTERGKGYMFAS